MCGIVGIYLKNNSLESSLGSLLAEMLVNMSSRGPDSAGFAIYKEEDEEKYKYSICINNNNFNDFKEKTEKYFKNSELKKNSDHVILKSSKKPFEVLKILREDFKNVSLVGYGKSIEIFKQVGNPSQVVEKFNLKNFTGTHAIGHTRMATESAITTNGSHPYSTGEDECLVHNGSLSNHNNLRRNLKKNGVNFNSENDTEVAAGYISNHLSKKKSLKDTLVSAATDFFTILARAQMKAAADSIVSGGVGGGIFGFLGGILKRHSGGMVRGGSGNKDDVPALLTGGEFVMRKSSVKKFGTGFMNAINEGAVPRFANGGMFIPGSFGQGAISGKQNLLNSDA